MPIPPSRVHGLGGRQEVLVADADALLNDACDVVKTGRPSWLLRACDAETAVPVMSEQAFWELGWNSAKCARGMHVDDAELRQVLENHYLPRIPVVATTSPTSDHWLPGASEVVDPADVPHVQVARLISADVIYSHDGHLRRPGFAPARRADYDQRLGHLAVVTKHSESEKAATITLTLAGRGTGAVVAETAIRLRIPQPVVWTTLFLAGGLATTWALRAPEGRLRVARRLEPALSALADAIDRKTISTQALSAFTLPPDPETHEENPRTELAVASYLVRHPGASRTAIASGLNLGAAQQRQLASLLTDHPAFARSGRHGWTVGTTRSQLETFPPPFDGSQVSTRAQTTT